MALYREHDDRLGIAKCHAMLAMSARAASDLDAAEDHYREALAIYRNYGERKGVAHQLNGLGDVARFRGDFAGADSHYRRAVDMFSVLPPFDTAVALSNLGIVARESADFERAEDAPAGARGRGERGWRLPRRGRRPVPRARRAARAARGGRRSARPRAAAAEEADIVDPDFAVPSSASPCCGRPVARASPGNCSPRFGMWTELGRTGDAARRSTHRRDARTKSRSPRATDQEAHCCRRSGE